MRPPRLFVLPLLLLSLACGLLASATLLAEAVAADEEEAIVFEAPGLGRLRGRRVLLPNGENGAELLGIPYANQPVGRFKPATVWDGRSGAADGEWDATAAGGPSPAFLPPPCPQMVNGTVVGTEDCLRLNLFLPPPALQAAASLPVYVFIHGGAYILGSPSSPDIDGAAFAAEKGAIVVTAAYRLGALGFLAHPAMAPQGAQGNLALLDLRVALEWVQMHIHHLGGDPERVTLGGQSAGAYLACLLLAMPEAAGTKPFRAVVLESGGCYAQPLALARERSRAWAEAVGCPFGGGDEDDGSWAASLECLEGLPLEALVSASTRLGQEQYHYWQPTVVDGHDPLPAPPPALLQANAAVRRSVPLIVGTNEDEGTLFLPPTGLLEDDSDEAYAAWVTGGAMQWGQGFPLLTAEEAERVLELYPPAGAGRNRWNAAAIIADAHYKCPTRFLAQATGGWRALFMYRFAFFQEACDAASLRCYHGSELSYIFGHPRLTPCHRRAFTPEERRLGDTMRTYWASLIESGRGPNADHEHDGPLGDAAAAAAAAAASAAASAAATVRLRTLRRRRRQQQQEEGENEEAVSSTAMFWPAFRDDGRMLRFDARNITLVPLDRAEVCDFWDTTRVYR